ncbi:Gfo/Idh/MocA family oxidoreductase [bacterium]|nr:Gfo/Idh/MocA family oxidoreductase [bacterium]MCK4326608.1 Gfo/Idh/MocA family oxidoreductase [bacterium]MCK4436983.1 Gfo/Idh/MocA family oxidoreductase [bacterium]
MKKIKVGVVGVGHLGKEHARIYSRLPQTQLMGVADIDRRRCKQIASRYNTDGHIDYKDLFGKVSAVSIAVPTHLHCQVARDFLRQGIHLLLEKPITQTVEEAEKLIRLSSQRNLVLQIGHIERYNAAVRQLETLVKAPRFIESHRLAPYQPRGTEVGVVLDLMVHDLDLILHLVKSAIRRIEALGIAVLSKYEDIANARLLFENGCVAHVSASRLSQERMRKIRIFQRDSYISLDCLTQEVDLCRKRGKAIIRERISPDKTEPLRSEIEDFIGCVVSRRRPSVSGEEGKRVLEVALEIEKQIQKCQGN